MNPRTSYLGHAAEDLKNDSNILEIVCPALSPAALSGTISAGITENNITLKDRDGNVIKSQYTTSNHIVATWEGSSNSRVPPLVRKGEPVEVYKIADQDKFYWKTTGRGRDFRTVDRVIVEVGATDPTKPGQAKDDSNTWSAYLDSERKVFGVRTSAVNGEATSMRIHGDMDAGTLLITDSSESPGNRIFLDTGTKSGTPSFHVNLSTGITLKMQGKDLLLKVPGKMLLSSDERIVLDSPLTVFNVEKKGNVIINAAALVLNATGDAIVKAGGVFGITAATSKVTGMFTAAVAKLGSLGKGPVTGEYSGVEISDPVNGDVSIPTNSSDTDPGIPEF